MSDDWTDHLHDDWRHRFRALVEVQNGHIEKLMVDVIELNRLIAQMNSELRKLRILMEKGGT